MAMRNQVALEPTTDWDEESEVNTDDEEECIRKLLSSSPNFQNFHLDDDDDDCHSMTPQSGVEQEDEECEKKKWEDTESEKKMDKDKEEEGETNHATVSHLRKVSEKLSSIALPSWFKKKMGEDVEDKEKNEEGREMTEKEGKEKATFSQLLRVSGWSPSITLPSWFRLPDKSSLTKAKWSLPSSKKTDKYTRAEDMKKKQQLVRAIIARRYNNSIPLRPDAKPDFNPKSKTDPDIRDEMGWTDR